MRLERILGRTILWMGLTLVINSLAFADIGRPGRNGPPTKVVRFPNTSFDGVHYLHSKENDAQRRAS